MVEHATGLVRYSPILRERDVAFGAAMLARLDLPTLVESDANAAAIAEHWFRRCRDADDFIVVTAEHALGLAVMHDGALFRGARGISFSLGDLVVGTFGGGQSADARLADVASLPAILAPLHQEPGFHEAMQVGAGLAVALKRQEEADAVLADAVARAGEALGIAVANLITLFAPPRVVLAGSTLRVRGTAAARVARGPGMQPAALALDDLGCRCGRHRRCRLGARRGGRGFAGVVWRTLGNHGARAAADASEGGGRGGWMKREASGSASASSDAAISPRPISRRRSASRCCRSARVADANPAAAEARGKEFGIPARSVDALLADPELELVVNLTTPKSHVAVGLDVIAAGKHVYSEKPLGIELDDARRLMAAAETEGTRVGCAPDTFLGGGHQTCRRMVDEGRIGVPVGGTAYFMCPGHERWHPNPGFYYEVGGGPMLDMGPYYITALVNLLGPVTRVAGMVSTPRRLREITSEPRRGQMIEVEVPTHVAGTMEFASGAIVQIATSFDVAGHRHAPIELYGTEGTLLVPDPNRFGGPIQFLPKGGEWQDIGIDAPYGDGNYRSIGAADLAHAIRGGRPHRASGALALHVLEVMEAFGRSSASGEHVRIGSAVERPAPLSESLMGGQFA